MKTPVSILTSSVERIFSEGLLTDKEYKSIMSRIVEANIKDKGDSDG